jgi:hypothetical protein
LRRFRLRPSASFAPFRPLSGQFNAPDAPRQRLFGQSLSS